MKRLLSLILSLLLLASCAAEPAPAETEKTGGDSPENPPVVETSPETEDDRNPPVPDVRYDDKDFRVGLPGGSGSYVVTNAFAEEINGEVVNDAVYNRNLYLEDRYGFSFVPLYGNTGPDYVREDYVSGSRSYDVLISIMAYTFPLAIQKYFYDWNTLEYVKTSDPWWDSCIARDLSLAGQLYIMAGDIVTSPMEYARFVYFNKGLIDKYNLTAPYDDVREGTWTMEKMTQMVAAVSTDLDGDGKYTANDRLGLLKESHEYFLAGCGVAYTEYDENGIPQVACINERTMKALEAIHKMFDLPNCTLSFNEASDGRDMSGYQHKYEYVRSVFYATNHFLFVQNGSSEAPLFRDMEPGYGVLPNPKLDEEQESYYHLADSYSCAWFLPADPVDIEMTDILLTAWAYCSDEVMDAYYEKTLKYKRFNAPEDAEMLDIIRSTLRYEIALICELGIEGVISNAYRSGNLASAYARSEKVITRKRDSIFKSLIGD